MSRPSHKLLVANRGEIAVRILRTAQHLRIPTVAIYTRSDATAPHVLLADEAVPLRPDVDDPLSNARGYLDSAAILAVCKSHAVSLLHPGYGFLSEDPVFASMVEDARITWLGPRAHIIRAVGLKHLARQVAQDAGVPLVPGSTGLVDNVDDAVHIGQQIGFPVMLKATAGGGGLGLVVCASPEEIRLKFASSQERAQNLSSNDGLFMERYYPNARHVEVQVFGDGRGQVIHMGERECSVQRRHQKVIEEAPSPYMFSHSDTQKAMWTAAVSIAKRVLYESAGTVEFLVDDETEQFFFLEMNTRLQVEHPVTEQLTPGLDLVEMMILEGIARRDNLGAFSHPFFHQSLYDLPPSQRQLHAIEVRVYCENPAAQFKPCPGVLQHVRMPDFDWLRVESWVETGTTVTPYFDPLACKLIVTGPTRMEAITRLADILSKTEIHGPPNNIHYLRAICASDTFKHGRATTTFLDKFAYTPNAFTVLAGGLETTVQDYPGRRIGLGIPRSGPMDSLAFRLANILVGNAPGTEALELTLTGCRLLFHAPAAVAVTGAPARVSVDGTEASMWARIDLPAGSRLAVGPMAGPGMRAYLAIRGGLPDVPRYLGSKATSLGLGGFQGRALVAGDHLALRDHSLYHVDARSTLLPRTRIPEYRQEWTIYVLPGPQCDAGFVTPDGIAEFFATRWTVSAASNRMGVRLGGGPPIAWARETGGEGGAHPSNILDNGYAFGAVNVNGDTPVILTHEGPDMGGYVCLCTVATAELWKLGQLRAGCTVRFVRISYEDAIALYEQQERFVQAVADSTASLSFPTGLPPANFEDRDIDPRLHEVPHDPSTARPRVVFRQAGDSAILVEFGEMVLDLAIRARIHAFETELNTRNIAGIWSLAPCIRSTMVHFDSRLITQSALLSVLIDAEAALPADAQSLTFPARCITFPVVLDDRWNREALERYMRSIRATAAYLPSNIEYLARNNGLDTAEEALKLLVGTDWLVLGLGFYLACPFLVPIDPRCRLVGQKMNPSRTYTPRGALGIAGLVAAIYPIESPGGYQLYGRTLPPWQTWGKGRDFSPDSPWLLRPFDQITFEVISEEEYLQVEGRFDAGQYSFKIEERSFSMAAYSALVQSKADEIRAFKEKQARGVLTEDVRERELFAEWDRERREAAQRATASNEPVQSRSVDEESGDCLTCSLTANIWRIKCAVGDMVQKAEDVLIVLEAMKTEIGVDAGDEFVGRRIKAFGRKVKEGGAVQAGDVLVIFE